MRLLKCSIQLSRYTHLPRLAVGYLKVGAYLQGGDATGSYIENKYIRKPGIPWLVVNQGCNVLTYIFIFDGMGREGDERGITVTKASQIQSQVSVALLVFGDTSVT